MSNVIHFPRRAARPLQPRSIVLSTEDLQFQQAIREQSAELRAKRNHARPNFERFWNLFGGVTDCGNPTGRPE